MKAFLDIALSAAKSGANCITSALSPNIEVTSESGRDIKLRLDKQSEDVIVRSLEMKSSCDILSEEAGFIKRKGGDGFIWIIDPIDGSSNFSRGFPIYGVSVALWKGFEEPIVGVVIDVPNTCVYWGMKGGGAFANGKRIGVSGTRERSKATLATGLPVYRSFDADSLGSLVKDLSQYKKIRMIGSAAMSLVYVARGAMDVYKEDDIALWDVAAGIAILQAAGGFADVKPGSSEYLRRVYATNGIVQ